MAELVDAYLSPDICHAERLKMAFRTRFFLDIWRAYLKAAGYAEFRCFTSLEATDIMRIVVEGLLGLVIVYRDYPTDSGKPHPLLPWLHSAEVCEHLFGECRKLVADFTYLDFIWMMMVPRLEVVLRSIVRFLQMSDPKARASGCAHTYVDPERVDLAKLSVFPSDSEIQQAAQDAWKEAESMFALVGIVPSDFLSTAT